MPQHSGGQIVSIAIVALVVIGIGALLSVFFGRRATSARDWLAAPASLPLPVVVITQFAAAFGGGVLIAHVGIAYAAGWSVFAYEGCVVLGFFGLALIARWLREQDFTTVPDILTRLFGRNRAVTGLAGIAALIVPFGALGTQFVAFGKLFHQLTGLPTPALILVITVGSLLFVLPGGLTSVAWTDFVFGVFKIVMSLAAAGYAIHLAGGWDEITARVPARLWSATGLTAVGGKQIWLWVAAVVPGTLTNQLYYQRVFATKNVRDARRGLVLTGIITLIAGVYAGGIGLAVRAMHPGLANPEDAAGWLIPQLPGPLLAVYGTFLVATIISASGAALQSVVANLTHDLYQNVFGRSGSDRGMLTRSRLSTVAIAALGGALAIAFPSALGWLVATYAYSAAILTAPIFLGYALRRRFRLHSGAALSSMLAGIIGCAAAQLASTTLPYVVYGIGASATVLLITTLANHAAPAVYHGSSRVRRAR
ncbi:MAG: sodium:solute symporter family protein [Pseudonocardia sp.]|nr:sodium:solute symporter family protein [Pseudonocardia sp.]